MDSLSARTSPPNRGKSSSPLTAGGRSRCSAARTTYITCEVVDDDYREIRYRDTVRLGNNLAVRVSPDGASFTSTTPTSRSSRARRGLACWGRATIDVTDSPLSAEGAGGQAAVLFRAGADGGQGGISCSSCHVDGERRPHLAERRGPARTRRRWRRRRGRTRRTGRPTDEVQDFEHTIRRATHAGPGADPRPRRPPGLGPPKGRRARPTRWRAYSNIHDEVVPSPHAKAGPAAAARRGRDLFFSGGTSCSTRHSGPFFTDRKPAATITRHDVGTGGDDLSEKMWPCLRHAHAPGRLQDRALPPPRQAATLADVLTTQNRGDKHGARRATPRRSEVGDLVEFLRKLLYEDGRLLRAGTEDDKGRTIGRPRPIGPAPPVTPVPSNRKETKGRSTSTRDATPPVAGLLRSSRRPATRRNRRPPRRPPRVVQTKACPCNLGDACVASAATSS